MIQRCTNPRHTSYPDYGGRGIRVADRWRFEFALFLADVGPKPGPDHTLDRVDPNGDYEPGNCRWATRQAQQRNRRKRVELPTPYGPQLLVEFAEETKQSEGALRQRVAAGWDLTQVAAVPVKRRLDPRVVKKILRAAQSEQATTTDVAKRFGVSQATVHAILCGRQWAEVTGIEFEPAPGRKPPVKITEHVRNKIRDLHAGGLSERAVATVVGVSRPAVHRCLTPEKE